MQNILIHLKSYEHISFFLRMQWALEKLGYNMVFITASYAAYRKLKTSKVEVYLIKNINHTNSKILNSEYLNKTFEFKIKNYPYKLINEIYVNTLETLSNINDKNTIEYIFIWNGCEITDKAVTSWAQENSIKTLYFEIGNFPGKIFVDKNGTNANSFLFKDKKSLKKFDVNKNKYVLWRDKFIGDNLHKHIVKQSKNIFASRKQFLWNRIGEIFITKFFCFRDVINKITKYLYYKIHPVTKFAYNNYDLSKKYIFFPLQVSTDTQIIIHSDIGLQAAIDYAIDKAKKLGVDLLVKPHPAESNNKFVEQLINTDAFYLVNYNTFELIKNAQEVITINSTVGLEAKIMGKKVDVLGRAFYKDFDEEDIARYIQGFLINVDYFSTENIGEKEMQQILNRANN